MVAMLLNLDASELDDFVLEIHWLLRKLELELSAFIIQEVQSLSLWLHIVTEEDQVNLLGWLSWPKVGPPSDELKRVREEVIINPFSQVQKSSLFRGIELSADVLIKRLITIGKIILGVWLSLIDEPVAELAHDSDELTALVGDSELEPSQSDDVSDTVDLRGCVWSLGVNDDC